MHYSTLYYIIFYKFILKNNNFLDFNHHFFTFLLFTRSHTHIYYIYKIYIHYFNVATHVYIQHTTIIKSTKSSFLNALYYYNIFFHIFFKILLAIMAPPIKNNNKGKVHNKKVFFDIPGSYTIH